MHRSALLALGVLATLAPGLGAQTAPHRPRLEGTWQAKTEDEIRNITVRSDSSAQFGDQLARWRVVADSLWITICERGWQVYRRQLSRGKRTLSGGRLENC